LTIIYSLFAFFFFFVTSFHNNIIIEIWLARTNNIMTTCLKKRKLTYTSFSVGGGHEALFTDTIIRTVGVHTITVLTNVRITSFAFVFVVTNIRYLIMHSTLGTHALEGPHAIYTCSTFTNSRNCLALVNVWKINRG